MPGRAEPGGRRGAAGPGARAQGRGPGSGGRAGPEDGAQMPATWEAEVTLAVAQMGVLCPGKRGRCSGLKSKGPGILKWSLFKERTISAFKERS